MKKLLLILTLLIAVGSVSAQSEADIWELAKSDLKTEYKTIIIESMNFSDAARNSSSTVSIRLLVSGPLSSILPSA